MAAWGITSWNNWGLSTKFLILSGAVVVVTLVGFAALDYVHEQQLLTAVHGLLVGSSAPGKAAPFAHDHAAFLAESKQGVNELFFIHFVHLTVTLLILFVALNLGFDRMILRPLRNLVAATNVMAHGTWEYQVRPESRDELGHLTAAFNALGGVLAKRVADWRNAERLSALAGLSNWATRELSAVESELAARLSDLNNEPQAFKVCRQIEQNRLHAQVARLQRIRERLETEFYGTFHEIRLSSVSTELPPKTEQIGESRADCKQAHSGGPHDHN